MTRRAKGSRTRKRANNRDEKGRFKPGESGNPKGRSAKKIELPELLCYKIADAMAQNIAVIGANGKKRMVAPYDLAAERLTEFIQTANLKELMAILEWQEKLGVVAAMRERAEKKGAEVPVSKADRELLAQIKPLMVEAEKEAWAAELEKMQRPQKRTPPKTQRTRSKAA